MNGYVVCAELRAGGADLPVLMLTAKDGTWGRTEGLDTGADDYLHQAVPVPGTTRPPTALIRRGPTGSAGPSPRAHCRWIPVPPLRFVW